MALANGLEQGCSMRPGCPSPTSTPEELERRALIQRNDLLLHEAVIKNDTEAVRRILKEPVDINSRNNVSIFFVLFGKIIKYKIKIELCLPSKIM